nr:MAG TPA: hypothetical protein [Caudoviricetes sp.]
MRFRRSSFDPSLLRLSLRKSARMVSMAMLGVSASIWVI